MHTNATKPLCLSIPLLLLLTGCGEGIIASQIAALESTHPIYRAYGDSITFGASLSDPLTQAYPSLVALHYNVTFADRGINGDQACDVAPRQIFPNGDSPSLTSASESSLLIGTNDVNFKGTGAYEAVFIECHQAAVAWLALPLEDKVLATDKRVTTIGNGHLDPSNNWNAWVTTGLGSSISFPITTTANGPLYAWPGIADDNPTTYTYSIDGNVAGTGTMYTATRIATLNGTTGSLGFIRIPNVPAGSHLVTFTQTNASSLGMSIVGIGAPPAPGATVAGRLPTVLLGTVPFQRHGASPGGACSASDAPCLEYIADIEADLNVFTGDGLDVRLFDTRKYMFGTASELNDALHPNVLGQIELSYSVESVY